VKLNKFFDLVRVKPAVAQQAGLHEHVQSGRLECSIGGVVGRRLGLAEMRMVLPHLPNESQSGIVTVGDRVTYPGAIT